MVITNRELEKVRMWSIEAKGTLGPLEGNEDAYTDACMKACKFKKDIRPAIRDAVVYWLEDV